MVWHALKEGRAQKSHLATIWLDIANAYGSIPHKLTLFALRRYGVFPQWIRLTETYYKGIFSKPFSKSATSASHSRKFLLIACFVYFFFFWLVRTSYLNTQCKSKSLNLPPTILSLPLRHG